MRITFVLESFGGGGKERRCLQLIQGLNKRGYNDIQVIIINNDIAYNALYETNISLHIIDRKNKGLNIIQTIQLIYQLLKGFNPDVVQVWGFLAAFIMNILRFFISFKYVGAYVANCNKPSFLSINRFIVFVNSLLADCVVGNSVAGIKAYGIPNKKAKVIYNGFNEERYNSLDVNKNEIKKQLAIEDDYIVSMFARVDENKDHQTFIKAAKLVLKKRKDVLFLIVGEGPNLLQIQSLISEKEKKHFQFLGFRTDVENIMNITDISILCTNPKKHKEGISNAIMESLAFGIPVLATNDGGTPEIVESGLNGFLVNAFDSDQLCEKIHQIVNDVKLQKILSNGAKETVGHKFTLTTMTNHYIELYKMLLKK